MRTLRQMAHLEAPLERRFGLLGDSALVQTNHPALLVAAEASLGRFAIPEHVEPVTLRLLMDVQRPLPGEGDIVHRVDGHRYLVSGAGVLAFAEVDTGHALAFVSAAAAADQGLVRYTLIEGLGLAMMTGSRGYFPLHACGIARNGVGAAVCGPPGAGKSTLAFAAARRGLDVFAEDAVFVRLRTTALEFWGMPWVNRLLPGAEEHFPDLAGEEPRRQPNGELKLEIDLDERCPGRANPRARPAAIVVLERGGHGPTRVEPLDRAAADRAVEALWPWGEWSPRHEAAATMLADLPVFRLAMSGTPDEAAEELERLLARLAEQQPVA